MAITPRPLSFVSAPASAGAKALLAALAISVSLGGGPALAQIDGPGSSTLRRPEWQPYRPSPTEPDRGQDDESQEAVGASSYGTRASVGSSRGTYRRPGSTSCVVPAGFQARVDPEPRSPAGHQPVPEYPEESPDIEPYAWGSGDCYPADCAPGWCRPCYSPLQELQGHLWVRGEYLLWWTEGSALPPLVTSSPVGTTAARTRPHGAK